MVWLPCSECIACDIMRKYRNDSLINEHKSMNIKTNSNIHNNTSAGTVLQAIKGERNKGRQACCRTTCRDSQTFVDLPRLPDWCSAYENSSIDDTAPPAIAVVPDFTSRRSPQSDHFHQRCRAVASLPTLTTTSSLCACLFLQT